MGFQPIPEVANPIMVEVKGKLPPWLAGSLYRLTASKFDIPLFHGQEKNPAAPVVKAMHWFDGLSMLHKFQLDGTTNLVKYQSRMTSKDTEQQIVADRCYSGFGPADPCRSLYKRVMSAFVSAGPVSGADGTPNLNVTITPTATVVPPAAPPSTPADKSGLERSDYPYLVAKTDYKVLQLIDPVTLNPLPTSSTSSAVTRFDYTDLSPDLAGGVTSAAHHHQDPVTGDFYQFIVNIKGPSTELVVFCIPASPDAKPRVVARVPIGFAPYMHSFAATADYLVFFLQPYYLGWMGIKGAIAPSFLDALTWDPNMGTRVVVVNKRTGERARELDMPEAMFFFHTVNAWQVHKASGHGSGQVVVDVVAYRSPSLVKKMMVDLMSPELRGKSEPVADQQLQEQDLGTIRRYTFPLDEDQPCATYEEMSPSGVELPRINPLYLTRPTRFAYCLLQKLDEATRQALDPGRAAKGFMRAICKVDAESKSFAGVWTAPGCYPGEPVFIPRPRDGNEEGIGCEEDDGVVLTIVLDAIRSVSFLLVLDGKTFQEVARAEVDGPMPFGFHGTFVGKLKQMDAIN